MRVLYLLSIVASAHVVTGSIRDDFDRLQHARVVNSVEEVVRDHNISEDRTRPGLTSSQLGLNNLNGRPPKISKITKSNSTILRANSKHRQSDEEAQCKTVVGDEYWPDQSLWEEVFPQIVEIPRTGNETHPNYYLEAQTAHDVQKAVAFCNEKNIRLSIISSGLDYLGRNDAPNGLLLSTRKLKGVQVHSRFRVSKAGARGVKFYTDPSQTNTIEHAQGMEPAVSFGAGVSTYELNDALDKSQLFAVGAADGNVSPAGGWSQGGGHGPLSGSYGLGVDQVLEYQVVTSDGELRIANQVSNPDLYWALRGGGGGTFGVIIQATMKAYATPKVSVASWWVNTTNKASSDAIYQAAALLHADFPSMSAKGVQGYYFIHKDAMRGLFFMDNRRIAAARNIWLPALNRLRKVKGIASPVVDIVGYDTYKQFFDGTFGLHENNPRLSQPRYSKPHAALQSKRSTGVPEGVASKHMLRSSGITRMDSRLLAESHLKSSQLAKALEYSMANRVDPVIRGYLIGKRPAHRQPINMTSVHPAWEQTVAFVVGEEMYPFQILAPETGVSLNEASIREPNWKYALWGRNYEPLLAIKQKFDSSNFFYVTPGIGADAYHVDASRLCFGRLSSKSEDEDSSSTDTNTNESSTDDEKTASNNHRGVPGSGDRTVPLYNNPLLAGLPPLGDNQNYATTTSRFLALATPWPDNQAAANAAAMSVQASLHSAWRASASKSIAIPTGGAGRGT